MDAEALVGRLALRIPVRERLETADQRAGAQRVADHVRRQLGDACAVEHGVENQAGIVEREAGLGRNAFDASVDAKTSIPISEKAAIPVF